MNTLQSLESDLALEPIPHHREARRTGRLAGRLRVVLPAVALLLLGPIFYHGMLTAGWAPANYDFVTYFVPYREYLVHAWTHGRPLPLWNSSVFLGAPFLANIQAAVLYPPNLLLLLPLRAETAVSWLLALHLGLAGAGMYLYALIGIRLRMPGSLVTALLFMLGSLMIGQADHVNQTNTLAWTPWLLLAADRTAVLPTPTRVAAVAVAVALVVLAGHTQQAYYTFVLVLLVVAARLWVLVVRRRWFRRAALGASALAAGVVLGGGIIALQLAATLELVRQSYRAAGLSAAVNAQGSLPLNGVLDNLLPNYVSEPSAESATAVGSAALLLIAIALLARWRRPSVAGWGLLAIAALVAALGPRGHLYDLLVRLLPGFGLFREPTRLVVFITISASILAGHGVLVVQQLATACRRPAWRRRTARVLLVAGTASLAPAAAFAAMFLAGDPRHGVLRVFPTVIPAENVLLIAALPIAALLLAVLAVGGPRRVRTVAIQVMLPLLVLADLWLLEMPTYPLNPVPDSLYRDRPAAAALLPSGQDQRYLTLAQTPVAPSGDLPSGLTPVAAHRYSSNRVLIDSLMPNVGMASLPPDADGYDGGLLPLGSYVSFRAPLLPPGSSNPP
ncbi:MAG: hypothetical protein J2P57_00150, partial [Acidimicrobiaceae bacterium]|nr:hypothetical protein [Acidimicrobiaceae bacterium]